MTLRVEDMQGLQIRSAGFTEAVSFFRLNWAELPNRLVSYQLAHKLLLYEHFEYSLLY